MGAKYGGRSLREWYAATLHGTDVLVSRQRQSDNPPVEVRSMSLHAYALLRHPNIVTLLGVTPDGEVITEALEHDLLPRPLHKKKEGDNGSPEPAVERKRRGTGLVQNLAFVRDIARAYVPTHTLFCSVADTLIQIGLGAPHGGHPSRYQTLSFSCTVLKSVAVFCS